jgi:hypothetical protein
MRKHVKKAANLHYRWWLGLFLVSALITVFALRANNQHMVKLRNDLYAADKSGQGVEQALDNLRAYVYGHMNTDLSTGNSAIKPPIQLQYTYQRLVGDSLEQAQKANQKIYNDAQNYCQSINQAFFGTTRVPCVQNYVSEHSPQSLPKPISPALYQFDFLSPSWSPDLAGFSLLITVGLFFCLMTSLARHMFAGRRDQLIN